MVDESDSDDLDGLSDLEDDSADMLMDLVGESDSDDLDSLSDLEDDSADMLMDLVGESDSDDLDGMPDLVDDSTDMLMDLGGESDSVDLDGLPGLEGIDNDFEAFSSLKTASPDDLTELLTNSTASDNSELEGDLANAAGSMPHFLEENKLMLENTDDDLALDELPDSVMNLIDHEGGSFANFDEFDATELLIDDDSADAEHIFDFDEAADSNDDGLNVAELENVDQQLNDLDSQISGTSLDELQNLFGSVEESVEVNE